MKVVEDVLLVTFGRGLDKEAGIVVSRVFNKKKVDVLKMEVEEQADILYRLLIDDNS